MVNIWKDWNLRQFKICKEEVPGSSTALKFLLRRYHMNLNKTWMIMVIIHTNNLAQKLLYLSFHFQNAVDCQAFLLSFTWRRGFRFLHIMLWDSSYGSVHFWNHPGSSPPHLVLILPSQAPFSYFAPQTLSSDLLWHLAYISKYLSTPSPSLFLFLPLSSPLLETNRYKGRGRGVRNCSSLFLRTKVG